MAAAARAQPRQMSGEISRSSSKILTLIGCVSQSIGATAPRFCLEITVVKLNRSGIGSSAHAPGNLFFIVLT